MKPITFIAIAAMSMWITEAANAQQNNFQKDQTQTPQVEGGKGAQGQRGKGRRGNRRRQGQGNMQQGKGQRGQGQGNRGQGQQGQGQRGGAQMLDGLFTRFDKDKNGSISMNEAPQRMKQRFATLDSNGDKSVSKEELQAAFKKMGQGRRGGQGENGQGKGGKGKGKDGAGKGGAGKDGAGKAGKGEGGAGKGGKGKDGAGKGGKRGQGQSMDAGKLMKMMDKNSDGVISMDEAPERMKQRFNRMDADSSGSVSADELKKALEMKSKGGKNGQIGRDKSANSDAKKPVKPKRPPTSEGA